MEHQEGFNGHKKDENFFLQHLERRFKYWLLPHFPKWIETYHLTYMTLIWCVGILLGSYFAARYDMNWLWLVSIMIVLQWFTDLFDGAIGRYRNTGLVRWGFYMDHFLDYVFLASIIIGYAFILPPRFDYALFFLLVIATGYMVSSFLEFGARNKFRVNFLKIGPTEVRLVFIVINVLLVIFGKTGMAAAFPYVLVAGFLGLIYVVYVTQKELWEIDMKNKRKNMY